MKAVQRRERDRWATDQIGDGNVLVGLALGTDDVQDPGARLNIPHRLHTPRK